MKSFAAKDRGAASSTRVKKTSAHLPTAARLQTQRAQVRQIIQAKVRIGQPNDSFEQEADRVADRVVANQPSSDISAVSGNYTPAVARAVEAETGETQQEELEVQRQAEEEEEAVQAKLLQRQAEEEAEPLQAKLLQRQSEEEEEPLQTKLLPRQAEEEEEAVQARLLQRQTEPEEEEPVQAKGAISSARAATQAVNSPAAGSPLRPDVKATLEAGIGADFSTVRVHEDSAAHVAAASINARAFTHKNHIWLGEGQSQSDLHLMAHEATHVVQQRGGLRASSREVSSTTPRVQRIWNPITAIGNAVSSAVEWVGDTIGEAVDYIKERAVEFVREIPGYSLFSVINGEDPITGRRVERNGINFINAGLDVIPNGAELKRKLEEEGALQEAAQWLDQQILEMDVNPAEIMAQLSNFWNSLTIADATRLSSVIRRFSNIIMPPINRIVRFARNVAGRLLEIVKNYVISSLINFIREQTNAYPLLTVILGRDPISNEPVQRTPIALLRGFMQLSESGQEQLRQMEESGSLQRAADWIDGAILRLNITWEMISESFTRAWNLVTIQNLLNPLNTFRELYHIFAGPAGRIIHFLIEVAAKVLGFIKDALINRLVAYARTVRGYPLIAVILGKDPFSQEPVERNTANIIRGFMSLMENGEQQYQEMEQSGAIARMTARVEAAMAVLNFTWEYIRGLFLRAWNSFSLQDLAAPFEAFRRLLDIFAGPILRLVSFVWEIIKIVIEVVMQVMNFPIGLIRNIITRAMQAVEDIKRDPVAFLRNLMLAVKTGFQQFFGNILTHLLRGLTGWLFGELRDANINPPADLSFRSILGFVLEVLGITIERIWQKLAERIGEERVARIRGMIDRLTGIWTFVKDVVTRGPIAIWEYIQDRLSNLWSTVLDAVRNWVITRIIQRVTVRLLSMLDPTGVMAVINGFIAFYNAVQSFIRYLREMLEIVNSFVVGVAEMARGNVTIAANFLEGALSQGMPVAIGFLANQVGLSGIGRRIGEMIERVRAMVDRALTWLVDRAVSAGTSFLNAIGLGGRGGGGAPDTTGIDVDNVVGEVMTVTAEDESHTLYINRQGSRAQIMMRSQEKPVRQHFAEMQARVDAIANAQRKQQAQTHLQQGNSKLGELQTLADQEASFTNAAQTGGANNNQNASQMSDVENNVRVKEAELKVIIQNILNQVNEDVREALTPYLNQPYENFQTALNNDAERLGLAKYYRTHTVGNMKIIARRQGQAEAAPRLRVLNNLVVEHDGRAVRHWEGILNYSNGQNSSGWLGAVSGGGTNPSAGFATYGLDARGHLIGAQFTGSNSADNLAAQQRSANSPTYTSLENPLKQAMVRTSMAVKMAVTTSGSTTRNRWQQVFSQRENVNLVSQFRNRSEPPENYNDADVPDSYLASRPAQYNISITHFQRVSATGVIANAGESGSDIGTLSFNSSVTNPVEDDAASLSNGISSVTARLEEANNKYNEQN